MRIVIEVAVEESCVVKLAHLLEMSKLVTSFFVDGLGVNQQQQYGVAGFDKWNDTVQM